MADPNPKIIIRAKDETKRAFKAARSNLLDFKQNALSLSRVLTGLAGAAGFGALIKSSLNAQDQIGKLSTRLGASTEALSQYRFVAEQTGVSFQTLTMGWQRMTRRISEAAAGTGEARGALQELNLSAAELNKLAPEKQFEVLADAIMKVKSPADQVRLAMKLFDSEGVALIQTMQGGSAAMGDLRRQAHDLGLTLSKDQTDAAAAANNKLNELKRTTSAMADAMTIELAPAINDVAGALTGFIPKLADMARSIMEDIGVSIAAISDYFNRSDITGPTTFEQSVNRMQSELRTLNDQLDRTRENLGAAGGGAGTQTGTIPPAVELMKERRRLEDAEWQVAASQHQQQLDEKWSREWESHQRELAAMWEFEDAKLRITREFGKKRLEFTTWSAEQQTKHVIGEAINLTRGVTGQSRKLFELNKAAGISNAIINTHEGVTKSLSKYPWPLAGAMAALHLASGMAQVQAIKSASFGGGGATGGQGTVGGNVAPPTPPSDFATPAAPATNQAPNVTIYIEGSAIGDDQIREVIVNAIETAYQNDELRA